MTERDRPCWLYTHAVPVALVVASIFALVALLVAVGATTPVDLYAKGIALSLQIGLLHQAALVATALGTAPYLVGVAVVAGVLVDRQGRRDEAILPILPLAVEWLANPAIKGIFHRQRPTTQPWPPGLFGDDQYSFPSGHSMASMALYSLLLCWAWSYSPPRLRVPLTIIVAIVPLAIGMSRVVLDVHWLSDVVGGWLAGAAVMAIVVAAWVRIRRPTA